MEGIEKKMQTDRGYQPRGYLPMQPCELYFIKLDGSFWNYTALSVALLLLQLSNVADRNAMT